MNETELAELQRDIDWRNNSLQYSERRDGEHIEFVAARINGGKIRVGELTTIDPEISFDQFAQRTYISRFAEWKLRIDIAEYELEELANTCLPRVQVVLGRTIHDQPCTGTGWPQIRPYLASPNWLMDIQGIGELHGSLDTPNSRVDN